MKQIDIICNDKIYTEMLCLELRDRGYRVSDKNTGKADIILCEKEDRGDANIVTFSQKGGADLIRPFDIEELVSLIESKSADETADEGLFVSPVSSYAVYKGTEVSLSELEHKILYYLYDRPDEYVMADELARKFFADEDKNTLRVYISYLRNKLDEAFGIKFIYTARGKGYMLKRKI
ncbi:MAG: winged helix-turn-helix transcriptional regulator [Clostridia bacterium]|nr:winged helix-turn-helix transcriptional regulator [Clostridia bacterium]